jgi:hypothetical protein
MEEKINKILEKCNKVGMHKVACALYEGDKGLTYGNADELGLVKAAAVLGAKLMMINKERDMIINGLENLR